MSLLDFPPLNTDGRPYALQEFNGRIITGNIEEFSSMTKCEFLADYPFIERTHLNNLQHSISKDNVRNAFVFKETDKMSQAWDKWYVFNYEKFATWFKRKYFKEQRRFVRRSRSSHKRYGNDQLMASCETRYILLCVQPFLVYLFYHVFHSYAIVFVLGRGVLRVRNGFASLASKFMPFQGQEKIDELLQQFAGTINWLVKNNWLRCFVVHEDGRRLAVCQVNNYIRIYGIGPGAQKTPLTLKHPLQLNVTSMAWQPFDQRVLAVATESRILIWRLNVKATNIKPSAQCAQVIDLSFGPISQIIWDRTTSSSILAISPNSTKIMIVDTSNGEIDSFGAWTGGNITRLIPTVDGRRIAILYTGNLIRLAIDIEYNLFHTHYSNFSHYYVTEYMTGILGVKKSGVHWQGRPLLLCGHLLGILYYLLLRKITKYMPFRLLPRLKKMQKDRQKRTFLEKSIFSIFRNRSKIILFSFFIHEWLLYEVSSENAEVISLFIVDWHPTVRLTPSQYLTTGLY
uniref:WD_REPEATS_REGION domain-containing protein n=1 Tax=Heterorhabditis bacteriophora TaxID=37862 RepID=A0A1I7X6Z2_HETBA